jgi:serine/threonine protein kinase
MNVGAFGEVRMCVHRDTGAQRAVKVLRKSHMDEEEKRMLFNEINILRGLVSTIFFAVLRGTTLVTIHHTHPPSPHLRLFLFNYYLLSSGPLCTRIFFD